MSRAPAVELLAQANAELDSLRRKVRSVEDNEQRLRKLLDKESARAEALSGELAAARRSAHGAGAESERLQREIVGLRSGRDSLGSQLEEKAVYIKRLEARLVGGSTQQLLVEQNARLRSSSEDLKRQAEGYKVLVEQQRMELQKALKEIEVLATALDMRAEELEKDGSLRSGLLYEVAARRHEVAAGEASLQEARAKGQRLEFELGEARLALGKATADVAHLEAQLSRASADLATEGAARRGAEQVREPSPAPAAPSTQCAKHTHQK
jgi:chromosome segregation ATPase